MVYRIKGSRPPETIPYVPPACRVYEEARQAGLAPAERRWLRGLRDQAEAEARQFGLWHREVDFEWYWNEYEEFKKTLDLPVRGRS
ncbi:MAG TPA: hypothetical protein VKN99_17185 [Polyangia bacterium]|nr:hypothetical protein [Polyangia bacterium]